MNNCTKENLYTLILGVLDAMFPTILKNHKDKFEPRATPHVFFGYPYNTKDYKVLDLATKKTHVCRDVFFIMNMFCLLSLLLMVLVFNLF